jgi:hypothetical protein
MDSRYHLVRQGQTKSLPSHIYIGEYTYTTTPPYVCQTVDNLKDVVQDQIASLPELESWSEHADDIQIQVYKVV